MSDFDDINFIFSPKILEKLDHKHGVTEQEVKECFYNSDDNNDLEDTREQHTTIPPTFWFLAYTNSGRLLKICYIFRETTNTFYIKSAYEPNQNEINIFNAINGTLY